ncbi:MAG: LarC family nickel insertion protein [Photobacterium frigidiphilum]|uniref:LarC family nickel insertion protein n=1 Tax=Photobacterium frigidiphilum TaxID=264736 RepID=UPI0030039639
MHIHLDLIGGIAGDMFVAAMLDARPELESDLQEDLKVIKEQSNVEFWSLSCMDKGLSGKRFNVGLKESNQHSHEHGHGLSHSHEHGHSHSHDHNSWSHIRQLLLNLPINEQVKSNAIGIFELLAKEESEIHGKSIEDVHFHEVGAWDCIVDIVSASWLIHYSKAESWSCSPVPWGGGTVKCAHGVIPVPAPATMKLLKGFTIVDDGIMGERVTPTGAAILAWLKPSTQLPKAEVLFSGYGFGQRSLPDRANLLRVTMLKTDKGELKPQQNSVTNIQFDIDDMTSEMLAIARESIREQPSVLEVTEVIAHGKKNRHISTLNVLCEPSQCEAVVGFILSNTSTIGVRHWTCQRTILPRTNHQVSVDNQCYDMKTVTRPDGSVTSKLESSHLDSSKHSNYQQKLALKSLTEEVANHEFK